MANDQFQEDQKMKASATKKAIIALVVGVVLTSVLFYFFKNTPINLLPPEISQESFQGAPEISSAVQLTCQESAKKVFEEKNCEEKNTEFSKNAANCLNIYYSIDVDKAVLGSEGNYGDLSLHIASCYAATDKSSEKSNRKAAEFLTKTNEQYDWDIYMGPIACDSKSTLAAYVESYLTKRDFKCLKTQDLPDLIKNLKNKKFEILNSLIPNEEIAHQGILEADVACPETLINIQKNLNQILSANFEITEPKLEAKAPDDIYVEITRSNNRILNLQFKIKPDQCLHFEALLAPSSETE